MGRNTSTGTSEESVRDHERADSSANGEEPADGTEPNASGGPDDALAPSRRTYLQLVGGGVVARGFGVGGIEAERDDVDGPPGAADMTLVVEDQFDVRPLDDSRWDVGWGWGTTTRNSPTHVTSENVTVRDGRLHLEGTHEGDRILSGCVNTKDKVTVEPGSYFEARVKFPDREGFLPAFWAKPNDETWPPEIDVVELFQDGSGRDDTHLSRHHLHYSESTEPGDRSTYEGMGQSYAPGDDLTENFHVYGVEWQDDRLTHYVDDEAVMVTTDPDVLEAMQRGAPFYLLCTLEIDKIGTADASEPWGESMVVDWVRVWE